VAGARLAAATLLLAWSTDGPARRNTAPATPSTPAAEALLARHVEAIGGASALGAMKALEIEGMVKIPDQGILASWRIERAAPNRFRTVISLPAGFELEEGFDGSMGWARDPAARPVDGSALGELRRRATFASLAEPDRWYSALQTTGPADFDGRRAWEVQATPRDGRAHQLYFDQESGLLLGSLTPAETGDGVDRQIHRDYSPHGQILLPMRGIHESNGVRMEFRVMSVTLDGETPAIAPPADIASALWSASPAAAAVPIRWASKLPTVTVAFSEGRRLDLVVDTGANTSAISAAAEAKLGLDPLGLQLAAGGAGGDAGQVRVRSLPRFRMGVRDYPAPVVVVVDELPVEGVLGGGFLSLHDVEFARDTLRLYPRGALAAGHGPDVSGLIAVPMESFAGGLLRVDARLTADGAALPMLIDTGADRTFLTWPAVNRVGIVPGTEGEKFIGEIFGIDGRGMSVVTHKVDRITLGETTWRSPTVGVANLPALERYFGKGAAGLLGADMLRRGRVVIDYQGHTVYLEPELVR